MFEVRKKLYVCILEQIYVGLMKIIEKNLDPNGLHMIYERN